MLRLNPLEAREVEPDVYLPYVRHVTPEVINLQTRAFVAVVAIEGVPFETADPADLNGLHAKLNLLLRNVGGDERLALWTHLVRRRVRAGLGGAFRSSFARDLAGRIGERLSGTDLYRISLYLSLVWHPGRTASDSAAAFFRRMSGARRTAAEVDPGDLKRIEEAARDVVANLEAYGARLLTVTRREDGALFSQPMELLHALASGEWLPMPLPGGRIGPALYTNRVIFGREALEIRSVGRSRYAGMLGIKEYPAWTRPGLLDGLLAAPFECVVTQSFACLAKANAKAVLSRKQNQLVSARDPAASQIEDLSLALDDLESNRFVMGDHHLSALVYADDPETLMENLAGARRLLADAGLVLAREDLGLEAAYWSQLPGQFRFRARSGAITSRNFAALSPFHAYPSGRATGNRWGEATALFQTSARTAFHFSWHHGDLGNTFICGPSGSGKTALLNTLLALSERHDPQIVLFDKDRGAEVFVRVVGGTYLALRNGVPTGCAPLKALDLTPENLAFLGALVRKLVASDGRLLSAVDEERIDAGLRSLETLPRAERSLSALRVFLGQGDREGIGARLERWCRGGPLGWALDADEDAISLDARTLGFDMTEVLDDATVRTPLMMVLFHRVERLIDGRRIVIAIDEFWKALGDEAFRDLAQNKLKTIRKQNGVMVFGTQSPRDALMSPIAHTIVEQCPTQVFFPNPRGTRADYVEGFHLTNAEFRLVHEDLAPESRRFLLKQGHRSVVAELDLAGLDDALAVLSGRTATVELLDRVRARVGDDPERWLPLFHAERRRLA